MRLKISFLMGLLVVQIRFPFIALSSSFWVLDELIVMYVRCMWYAFIFKLQRHITKFKTRLHCLISNLETLGVLLLEEFQICELTRHQIRICWPFRHIASQSFIEFWLKFQGCLALSYLQSCFFISLQLWFYLQKNRS